MTIRLPILLSALLVGVSCGALAAGSSSSSSRPAAQPSAYDRAVQAVKAGDYRRALQLLDGVVASDPRNADAWNYIGFSQRKLDHYDQALTAYNKALAIDPKHLGANEYLGELYLDMGDVEKARSQLDKLRSYCRYGCDEYDDLQAAIKKHGSG